MVFATLLKPRAVALSEGTKAVKGKGKFTSFLRVVGDNGSGKVAMWFKDDVYNLKWECILYPDHENSTPEAKLYILALSAPSKAELNGRIAKIKEIAPESFAVAVLDEPLALAESCKELLGLGAQKEGGLR